MVVEDPSVDLLSLSPGRFVAQVYVNKSVYVCIYACMYSYIEDPSVDLFSLSPGRFVAQVT